MKFVNAVSTALYAACIAIAVPTKRATGTTYDGALDANDVKNGGQSDCKE